MAIATPKEITFENAGEKLGDAETIAFNGPFAVWIAGTYSGTILLRMSYDNGATWITVKAYSGGAALTEPDRINLEAGGMRVQLSCTVLASGTPTVYFLPL